MITAILGIREKGTGFHLKCKQHLQGNKKLDHTPFHHHRFFFIIHRFIASGLCNTPDVLYFSEWPDLRARKLPWAPLKSVVSGPRARRTER
jgi:hypothetical protein